VNRSKDCRELRIGDCAKKGDAIHGKIPGQGCSEGFRKTFRRVGKRCKVCQIVQTHRGRRLQGGRSADRTDACLVKKKGRLKLEGWEGGLAKGRWRGTEEVIPKRFNLLEGSYANNSPGNGCRNSASTGNRVVSLLMETSTT